ncbi:LuxR C-terminal-related transcriptional regulator [Thermoanaerobacterium thermosaccharolyticum]|uniref:LuxR C-terminal-related transcriptional regulator n=1 Tax=Thermoanaerobacterium thermosaccharolyticum TaxID=1517 RepID=UPI0020A40BB7|nr:LuxR C-terminal-related transcriptional regulator [Thermoanaerobacterium thermosaccharolyticum]MCP2238762.1 transcriptional regulator of acetoin/glycerol metabolism [Thermoanaerobacterium thermosaccharolyticum]
MKYEVIKYDTHKHLFDEAWRRCTGRGLHQDAKPFMFVSDLYISDEKKLLIKAFRKSIHEISKIDGQFKNYTYLLTDENGVIIDLIAPKKSSFSYLNISIPLKEEFAGINAVSIALNEREAAFVKKNEHYLKYFREIDCIAVPVFDNKGQLIGVIDISRMNGLTDECVFMVFLMAKYTEYNFILLKRETIKEKFEEVELKILKLTAEGKTDEEIAKMINRSISNVKYHKNKIFEILNVKNVKDCIYKAARMDLI